VRRVVQDCRGRNCPCGGRDPGGVACETTPGVWSDAGVAVQRANLSRLVVEELAHGWRARHGSPPVLSDLLGRLAVEEHVDLQAGADLERARLVGALTVAAGSTAQLAAHCAAADEEEKSADEKSAEDAHTPTGPCIETPAATVSTSAPAAGLRCVCGGQLLRLGGRSRCLQLFAAQLPQLPPEQLAHLVEAQLATGSTCVVCDLCDRSLPPGMPVYTCGNGERTILHPTTYDVCDACFVRYGVEGHGDEALATERQL